MVFLFLSSCKFNYGKSWSQSSRKIYFFLLSPSKQSRREHIVYGSVSRQRRPSPTHYVTGGLWPWTRTSCFLKFISVCFVSYLVEHTLLWMLLVSASAIYFFNIFNVHVHGGRGDKLKVSLIWTINLQGEQKREFLLCFRKQLSILVWLVRWGPMMFNLR